MEGKSGISYFPGFGVWREIQNITFCRYNLIETMPISMMKHLDEDVPPVFMILDTFDKDVKSLVSVIKAIFIVQSKCKVSPGLV